MEYTSAPLLFKVRKALRYVGLYGVRRTLTKIRGRYHMRRSYSSLPENHVRKDSQAHVGIIGCGNYGYSVIAYFLHKNYGRVIRGCMDIDVNRAASLFEGYKASYFTTDADEVLSDPNIRLIYVASNHASHAEYAIKALEANKDVHIEKPHVVSDDQLERLCTAERASRGRIVSIGFNRPRSTLGNRIRHLLEQESGALVQNWFVAGHEIAPDHWYFNPGEGGRVLGNLCHWAELTYQMMSPEERFPISVAPAAGSGSSSDLAVMYTFGDGSIGTITFSEKGEPFEGVRERYAAHRGNTILAMDDFQSLTADIGHVKKRWSLRNRDHGHEASVQRSYQSSADPQSGFCDPAYVWEAGQLFLRTKEALETDTLQTVSAWRDPSD